MRSVQKGVKWLVQATFHCSCEAISRRAPAGRTAERQLTDSFVHQRRESHPLQSLDAALGVPRSEKVTDMQTAHRNESDDSPAPGIIPNLVRVHDQPAAPRRPAAPPVADRAGRPLSSPSRRSPASTMVASVLSVIRGDRHTVGAHPSAWQGDWAKRDEDRSVRLSRDGALSAAVRSAGVEPSGAERAGAGGPQARER